MTMTRKIRGRASFLLMTKRKMKAPTILIREMKRQFFIMLKELLTHIPFHVGTHHMTLIADIIFAQALDHVHQE